MSVTNAHNLSAPALAGSQPVAAPEILPQEPEQDKKLLHSLQAKLTVGSPDDPLENEADAMADRVMRMPDETFIQKKSTGIPAIQRETEEDEQVMMQTSETFLQKKCAACEEEEKVQRQTDEEESPLTETFLQRKCAACEEEKIQRAAGDEEEDIQRMADHTPGETFLQKKCAACEEEEEKIQRKPVPFIQKKEDGSGETSSELTGRINNSRGSGSSMDEGTKTFMESRFGADFSGVNIHTGSSAASMNRELNAKAFTVGNDIYFNEGQYNPSSESGKHLLAHELTHTIQQGASERVQQKANTAIVPLIQRVPDDEKTLSPVKDEKIFGKNLTYWENYELYTLMPLREITPETAPFAYSNRTYRAQQLIRSHHLGFNKKNIGVDGILGPEMINMLYSMATVPDYASLKHQLAGLGFDMEALATKQAYAIVYKSRINLFKLNFKQEWNVTGPADMIFQHITTEDEKDMIYWCDQIIFGNSAIPQTLIDQGFTLGQRYAILKKLYAGQTFNGRAAFVTANRNFIDNSSDNAAMVERDPGKPSDNPLRIVYSAEGDGKALKLEDWFGLTYPSGKKAKGLRQQLGVNPVDGVQQITGLLVSFYIPTIDTMERARINIIRDKYIEDIAADIDQYTDAKLAAIIRILNDDESSRYVLPGRLRDELSYFTLLPPHVFEVLIAKMESHPDGDYFARMLSKAKEWENISMLQKLVQLCNRTKYKDNAEVKEAFGFLQALKQHVQSHDYVAGPADQQGVWINKERGESSFLRVNDVTTGMYRITETKEQLKEAKRKLLEAKLYELIEQRISNGLSDNPAQQPDMDENKLMEAVLEQAAKEVGITEDDIEEVTYERAFRLKGVESHIVDGVEDFYIAYEEVERLGGSGEWAVRRKSSGYERRFDFEESLGWYKFSNTMKATQKLVTYMAIGELVIVGGVFLLAGGGTALVALGGGAKMISISIGISMLIYWITTDHVTVEGLLKAALEGYLMAVGLKLLAPVGAGAARWIGTATFRQKLYGLIAKSVIVGGGSGALTGAGGMLIEDIIRGKLRSPADYLKGAAFGFVVGALFDLGGSLIIGPLFRTTGRNVLERIGNIQQLKTFLSSNSIALKPALWGPEISRAYSGFVFWLKENVEGKMASELMKEAKDKAVLMINNFADAFDANIHRQALELIDFGMTRESSLVFDQMVTNARNKLGAKASRALLDDVLVQLVKDPKRINPFLSLLGAADEGLTGKLFTGRTLNDLATSDALLKVSAMREPKKMVDLLNLHFNQDVNTLESWARGLINQTDDAQVRILQLLETRGASVTPESLLRIAQSKSALTDDVIEGLTRMITEARGKNISPASIETLLNNVADDKLQAFLIATGQLPKSEFDDIIALLAKPEQAGKLISYTNDAGQLVRILNLGSKNADEIATLFAATKGKGQFPDEIESLLGRFTGNTARVRQLVKQLDGDAALLERSIVRMNKADVEKVMDKAMAQLSTQTDAVAMRRFMLLAEIDAITDPQRLVKFLEAVQRSQTGAIPTNFATAVKRLELMIANHPKTMLPFAQGSKTTLARTDAFHDIALTGGGDIRISISEYDLYHYGKGHLTDKFSFDIKNLPPKRKKTTFWPPKTTIDQVYADAKAILADPKVKTLVDATGGPNYRTDTITFGKFDYFVGIDMTEKRLVQFFPTGSKGGAIETSGDILAGVKAYFGL